MSAQLKLCPFCGGKAKYYIDTDRDNVILLARVQCTVCGADVQDESRSAARDLWDRRVEPSIDANISKVIDLLTDTRDALGLTVAELKEENARLKERLARLERPE